MLQQTRHLGVPITTAQANAAIMALGKLGDVEVTSAMPGTWICLHDSSMHRDKCTHCMLSPTSADMHNTLHDT